MAPTEQMGMTREEAFNFLCRLAGNVVVGADGTSMFRWSHGRIMASTAGVPFWTGAEMPEGAYITHKEWLERAGTEALAEEACDAGPTE